MTARRLTYWPSGGEVVATHGRNIALDDAKRLRALYLAEAGTAEAASDYHTCATALRLAMELREAAETCIRWRRAACAAYGRALHGPGP